MYSKLAISENDILKGTHIQLEPIANHHRDDLRIAAADDHIWQFMPHKATQDLFDPWFDQSIDKMQSGEQITYVVRRKACLSILGATAYYDIQLENKRLGLGYSWYSPAVWGSEVNPESKLLMLMQAFECWHINRVEIGTDSRNIHSYKAIKKLGATEEGILRQHMILHDKAITDTIIFSILSSEWPDIKMQLLKRLELDL